MGIDFSVDAHCHFVISYKYLKGEVVVCVLFGDFRIFREYCVCTHWVCNDLTLPIK